MNLRQVLDDTPNAIPSFLSQRQSFKVLGIVPPDRGARQVAVRREARELGIDIHSVPGSGPGGRVTDGLVALYGFEESSGQVVYDESGVAPAGALGGSA